MTPKFLVLRRSFMSGRLNNGVFEPKYILYDRSLIVGYDPFPPDRRAADPEIAWVFIDGGIRNVPTTTGFSSRVSRHLHGTGRRTSSRATVFCVRRSRARSLPFLNAGFLRTVWRVCAARGVVMTSLWPFPAGLVWSVQAARPGVHFCSVKRSGKSCIR